MTYLVLFLEMNVGKPVKALLPFLSFLNMACVWHFEPKKLSESREVGVEMTFPDKYQVTSVGFSDASDKIYSGGGIDNDIKVWDIRLP
ncbi:hypothetical protein L6452_23740 [Arctium lappa]|uniref:Uncharacterized protein n=1 Tax=Arctium lappa TaxID=4217 RepID=A0ACB9A862_ARCLA|nr:hypothetical protein L6452_23740 [Arctium lappa]